MVVRSFPHLGWDPAPGDVEGTRMHARRLLNLAAEIEAALRELDGADDGRWVGRSADAFRNSVYVDLVPPLRAAWDSFDHAGATTHGWAGQLADFQAEADRLEHQAAAAQQELSAAANALATAPAGADRAVLNRLQDRVSDARGELKRVQARAEELHDRYRHAARAKAAGLAHAQRLAPDSGVLDWALNKAQGLMNMAGEAWDNIKETVVQWVRDNADLFKAIGEVLTTLSTVAGLLAFIPPLSGIMGPLAVGASLLAAGAYGVAMVAGAKGVGLDEIGFALAGAALGGASMKLGKKVADIYRATGRSGQLTSVLKWNGGTTDVAPGIFQVAGRAATGQSMGTTATEVGIRFVKFHVDGASLVTTGVTNFRPPRTSR